MKVTVIAKDLIAKDLFHEGEEWDVASMSEDETIFLLARKKTKMLVGITNNIFKELFGEEALRKAVEYCKQSPLTIMRDEVEG